MFLNLYILLFINEGQGALRIQMEQSLKLLLFALCFFLQLPTVWYMLLLCVWVRHAWHGWQGACPRYVTRALFSKLYVQRLFPNNVGWLRVLQPN